jgi:hypothetical protein
MQRIQSHPYTLAVLGFALALFLSVGIVLAVDETLERGTVSSGGSEISDGGLTLQSSAGQPVVGAIGNSDLTLCSGLLCGEGAPAVSEPDQALYLPLVQR